MYGPADKRKNKQKQTNRKKLQNNLNMYSFTMLVYFDMAAVLIDSNAIIQVNINMF